MQFRDLFASLVHDTDQPEATKLSQLRQHVDATKVSAVAGSYVGAYHEVWEELTARYDKNRKLVGSHCAELSRLPINPHESKAAIERVVDATRGILRAMRHLGKSTESWDPILYTLITERLPIQTVGHWHTMNKGDAIPPVKQLLEDIAAYSHTLRNEPIEQRRHIRSFAVSGPLESTCCHFGQLPPL